MEFVISLYDAQIPAPEILLLHSVLSVFAVIYPKALLIVEGKDSLSLRFPMRYLLRKKFLATRLILLKNDCVTGLRNFPPGLDPQDPLW
jgi:hypothetical protein